jgi:hypothetical protein
MSMPPAPATADLETRIRHTLGLVREALKALEADQVLREALAQIGRGTGAIESKLKLDAIFLADLHQARWAERLAQLRDQKHLAAPEEQEVIEARIREHYTRRHDLDQTRRELEASYAAPEVGRAAIPTSTPAECLRRIERILVHALERLETERTPGGEPPGDG